MLRLTDFDALSFDCYGTLIDWETGIWQAIRPWRGRTGISVDRDDLLEAFGALESAAEAAHPEVRYSGILRLVMAGLGERFGQLASDEEVTAFGDSVREWPAFPDSRDALARLGDRYRLIVLSNVDHRSFAASAARLGVRFDAVITAEDVGEYKPDARTFEALLRTAAQLGVPRERLLHVAQSLFHDHVPAKDHGLATVWIDRRQGRAGFGATPRPPTEVRPDRVYPSMAAFADACESEAAGG